MPTITITQPDGSTQEFDASADGVSFSDGFSLFKASDGRPDGFYSATDLEAAKTEAASAARQGLHNPADLVKDSAHQKRVLKAMGIQLGTDGMPVGQLTDADRSALQEVDTLRSENKTLTEQNKTLTEGRDRDRLARLKSNLVNAYNRKETYLRRDKLETDFPGEEPGFIIAASRQFEWSDTHGDWVFRDEHGNVVMTDAGKPAGVDAFAKLHHKRKPRDFEDMRPRSPAFDDLDSTGGASVTISKEDSRNPTKYKAALKAAGGDHRRVRVLD